MRNNVLNVVVFMFLAGAMFFLWQEADKNIPKPEKKEPTPAEVEDKKKKDDEQAKKDATKPPEGPKEGPKEPPKIGPPPPPATPPTLIALGDDTFYNRILLTTQGAGIQQVVLPRFGQANRLGKPVMQKDASGNPTDAHVPLYLIPGVHQPRTRQLSDPYVVPALVPGKVADPSALAEPCATIFHYPTPEEKYPDPRLGEVNWKPAPGYGDEKAPQVKVLPGGEHEMAFETELGAPYFVKFTKTYTLSPKDYHVGLKVVITKLANDPRSKKGEGQLRYQLAGPHGLPIEGEWYTSIYRVAIIGWWDNKNTPRRQYEDSASIAVKRGGESVARGDNQFKYMAVANQYFASAVAVDNTAEGPGKNPWAYVRATTEIPFDKKQDPNVPYFDDITVRAASETIDLEPGKSVTHSYLIYNGPAKVGLLKLMADDPTRRVDDALVDRYKDDLSLSTITDFRSETWLGRFLNSIYWSDLVIACTNLMHFLLSLIHHVIPNWALCIVVVTGLVRMLLLVPSRKQTAMSMKMMEVQKQLQPELEKLQEKYKDDQGAYNREKMRLMMQHGANPFAMMGGCLLLLAQMPIMMGLYFCLQESVFFRLDSFLWIENLAVPDMMIWWTETIPYVSTPEDLGSFIYLGPFFNLLPLLAVGLMLYQQAKMMPPSTDPQAEQQRMMMKIMMVMMAFFFYKVAAGLALYFIVSTAWAIAERQFIPKPKINMGGGPPDGDGKTAETQHKAGSHNGKPMTPAEAVAAAQQKSKGLLGRLREALQKKMEEMQKRADEQSKRQIRNEPGQGGGNASGPGDHDGSRRDKKKKRRK